MRLALVILVLLAAASAAAQAVDPYQWIGNTSAAFPASSGIVAPTAACQSDYHPSARICRLSEVLDTVVLPSPAPTVRGRLWDDRDGGYGSCAFWGGTGVYLTVNPAGQVEPVSCANPLPSDAFACCRPIPLPDPTASIQNVIVVVASAFLYFSPRTQRYEIHPRS